MGSLEGTKLPILLPASLDVCGNGAGQIPEKATNSLEPTGVWDSSLLGLSGGLRRVQVLCVS